MFQFNRVFQLSLNRFTVLPCKLKEMGTTRVIKNQTTRNRRQFSSNHFEFVDNIKKDTVVYALQSVSNYFRRTVMSTFCALICIYGSTFVVTLIDLPEESKHLGPVPFLLKYRILITGAFAAMGVAAFTANKYFLWRTISRIELKADGKRVSIMALNRIPLSTTQYSFEVPLEHISCVKSRVNAKQPFAVIKIKGKRGSYYIDKEGIFPNPSLFDYSIGVSRNI